MDSYFFFYIIGFIVIDLLMKVIFETIEYFLVVFLSLFDFLKFKIRRKEY